MPDDTLTHRLADVEHDALADWFYADPLTECAAAAQVIHALITEGHLGSLEVAR